MRLSVKEIIEIVHKMKTYGCVLFGAGNQGRIAFRMLDSVEIRVKAVFDSVEGKEIMGRKAQSLNYVDQYSPKTVCIVTPAKDITDIWSRLSTYFEVVIDMQIFDWMIYMVPDKENSIFMDKGVLHPFNFYDSPYLSKKEWTYYEDTSDRWQEVVDINLNIANQKILLHNYKKYFIEFQDILCNNNVQLRYTEENDMFSLPDALMLHSMIREYKPRHIVEIGSGYSTFVMLDTIEFFMEDDCSIICIEQIGRASCRERV